MMLGVVCLSLMTLGAAEPEPATTKPREIALSGSWSAPEDAKFSPIVIRTKAQLEKAIDNKAVRAEILKAVNWDQDYLVIFAWSGSGGDQVRFEVTKSDKGSEVVFRRRLGLTDDLREHRKVFALPKMMKHRLME
ncbi:MAG: hypothetical protein SNJ82_10205 [Gemmataceae bacterium]